MKVSKPLVFLPIIITIIIIIIINSNTDIYRESNIKGIGIIPFLLFIYIPISLPPLLNLSFFARLSDFSFSIFCVLWLHSPWLILFDMVSHCIKVINSNESIKGVFDSLSIVLMKLWYFWVDYFTVFLHLWTNVCVWGHLLDCYGIYDRDFCKTLN